MSLFALYDMAMVPAFCLLMASESSRADRRDGGGDWRVHVALVALVAVLWPVMLPVEAYLRVRGLRARLRGRR